MSDDSGDSRRQIARRQTRAAGDRSTRVANVLMKMAASTLRKLGLDDELREVVDQARAVTAPGARRRSERALAGALRRVDLRVLEARIATVLTTGAAEPQQMQLAEQWRTRLLDGGLAAAAEFPGGPVEPLPELIARAQRERTTGKPPGAARALFRHIAAVLKAQQARAEADGDPEAELISATGADDDDDDDDNNED